MDPDLMDMLCMDDRGNIWDCSDGQEEYVDDRPCAQPGWVMDWDAMRACHETCAREHTGFDNVLCNDHCEWEFCYEK